MATAESEDKRTRERALLLMRFYWLEDIYNLGRSLHIPYFGGFEAYWDIGYDDSSRLKAASALSQALSDDALVKLTTEKPPKYGLDLGGFQGNYYSCEENGRLKLEGSWGDVRKNVRKALGKWDDRAYGVLKAFISREGRLSYVDLLVAIEEALGYEFTPSSLLPRLRPLKLVFKTGSNKYPDWTMPTEIIPVVEHELADYEITRKPAHKKDRASAFISYSSDDAEFVARLASDLASSGKNVWWDRWEIRVGDSIVEKINNGISRNDYLIVVLSPNSVRSAWVKKELNMGLMRELTTRNVVILPIVIADCNIPAIISDKRYADFRVSYDIGLSDLLSAILPKRDGHFRRANSSRP